jgi:hypothetical protein
VAGVGQDGSATGVGARTGGGTDGLVAPPAVSDAGALPGGSPDAAGWAARSASDVQGDSASANGAVGPSAAGLRDAPGVGPSAAAGYPDISGAASEGGLIWPEAAAGEAASRRSMSPELQKGLDIAISIAGLVIATLLAGALAIIEALYSPLRIGGVRVPVSLVMAVATNPLLGWFAITTTKHRLAALLPAGVWCVLWFLAAGRTSEGDLIITQDNWVGLLTLFAGPLAFGAGIYISILRHRVAGPGGGGPAVGAPTASKPART